MNRAKIRPEGCARTGWKNPGMGKIPASISRAEMVMGSYSCPEEAVRKGTTEYWVIEKKTCPVDPSQALFRGLEVRLPPLFVWRLNKRAQEGRNRGKSSKDTYQERHADPPRLVGRVGRRVRNVLNLLRPARIRGRGHSCSESGKRTRKRGVREILSRKTAAKHTIFYILFLLYFTTQKIERLRKNFENLLYLPLNSTQNIKYPTNAVFERQIPFPIPSPSQIHQPQTQPTSAEEIYLSPRNAERKSLEAQK